jgi:hypothetical protein
MASSFNEIGIECVTASLVESVDVTKSIEHKIVKTNLGGFDSGTKFDPMFEFTVKGRGSALDSVLGTAGATYLPDHITGGVTIIKSVKNSETNEDFNTFEISGMNYPAASNS